MLELRHERLVMKRSKSRGSQYAPIWVGDRRFNDKNTRASDTVDRLLVKLVPVLVEWVQLGLVGWVEGNRCRSDQEREGDFVPETTDEGGCETEGSLVQEREDVLDQFWDLGDFGIVVVEDLGCPFLFLLLGLLRWL